MKQFKYKISLLGLTGVGKTSVSNRYVHNSFTANYSSTIGVRVLKKEVAFEDKNILGLIWDMAGDIVSSKKMIEQYIKGSSAVIHIVDGTQEFNPSVFESHIEAVRIFLPNVLAQICLVNKLDLSTFDYEISKTIKERYSLPCHSVSAKNGDAISKVIDDLMLSLSKEVGDI